MTLSEEIVTALLLRMRNRARIAGCEPAAENYDAALAAFRRTRALEVSHESDSTDTDNRLQRYRGCG